MIFFTVENTPSGWQITICPALPRDPTKTDVVVIDRFKRAVPLGSNIANAWVDVTNLTVQSSIQYSGL